jgi:putative sterol carrier protein
MATVKELMERASRILAEHKAEARQLSTVYKFVLEGEDGGTFVLDLTDNPSVSVGDGPANCTIRLAAADFVEMAEGRIDSRDLFFAGKLRVDGDMGLALKLKKLRDTVRATQL